MKNNFVDLQVICDDTGQVKVKLFHPICRCVYSVNLPSLAGLTASQAVKFAFQPLVSSFRPFHTSEVNRGHDVKWGHTSKSPNWRCSACFWVLLSRRARKTTLKHCLLERNRPKIKKRTCVRTVTYIEQPYTLEAVIMPVLEIWGWNLSKMFIGQE